MSDVLTIDIDGKACECEPGEYLYDIAKRNGIFIPTLCRKDEMPEHRACCRVCLVEVETRGRTRVVTSCAYPVTEPCKVRTDTERIREDRAVVLALLSHRAPASAEISQMAQALGGGTVDGLVSVDGDKCIVCGLCVQACHSNGASAIGMLGHGPGKYAGAPFDIAPKPCIGDLSCAKICPTGAISYTENEYTRSVWGRNFTLMRCEKCGKVIGTVAMYAHSLHDPDYDFDLLCEECRQSS